VWGLQSGTSHWWSQRVTAWRCAVTLWFVFSLLTLPRWIRHGAHLGSRAAHQFLLRAAVAVAAYHAISHHRHHRRLRHEISTKVISLMLLRFAYVCAGSLLFADLAHRVDFPGL